MRRLLNVTLLLILLLTLATPAFAQGGPRQPGQVIFGSNRHLEPGDVIEGDLVIFGGNLRMADGSRIEGDAVVFGGTVDINGEIVGDLAVIGGTARLGETARVEGDVAAIGGQVSVDEQAYVRGEVIQTNEFDLGQIYAPFISGAVPPAPRFEESPRFDEPFKLFSRIVTGSVKGLVMALVIAGIGLLVVLFLPGHTNTVGQTVREMTPTSFGVGLLTLIVGITAMILLFITCCLIPVGLLLALALVLATLYGWIVVGYLLGVRILRAIQNENSEPTVTTSALVGIFLITLIQQGLMALSNIPCLGFFFWLMGAALWLFVASTGLGAVVLTRFGTQPYTRPSRTSTPRPSLPTAKEEEPEKVESPDEAEPGLLEEPTDESQDQDT
jgi:cytoskeletal protein CcmA (bactofilin family)